MEQLRPASRRGVAWRNTSRSGRPRLRITDRDLKLLTFVAEQRIVLAAHAQALLSVSADVAAARLRALTRADFLDGERVFQHQPKCWWITRRGLDVLDSKLPPSRLNVRNFNHDVGLAWLWLAAHRGAFGPLRQVVSEREMRSRDGAEGYAARAEGRGARQFGVRLGGLGPGGRERLHYPDLLLVTDDGRRVALELELSTKPRGRREGILAAYGTDRGIDELLYLVDRPNVARAVQSSADRLGMSGRLQLQRVRWGQSSGHLQGRGAGRQPARAASWEELQR